MVLTEITRLKFGASGLGEILLPHLVICKDEMTESAEAEGFQARLWATTLGEDAILKLASHKSVSCSSFANGMPARIPAKIFISRRFAGPSLQV